MAESSTPDPPNGGPFVRLEVTDGVGTIRLDRPPVNALNTQTQDELHAVAIE
ncbi:MAG: hypothetical protein QOH29_662, partial [Actinomycetota bacterium]|nr:hypothetical protein [Actinomycetota bacterium]